MAKVINPDCVFNGYLIRTEVATSIRGEAEPIRDHLGFLPKKFTGWTCYRFVPNAIAMYWDRRVVFDQFHLSALNRVNQKIQQFRKRENDVQMWKHQTRCRTTPVPQGQLLVRVSLSSASLLSGGSPLSGHRGEGKSRLCRPSSSEFMPARPSLRACATQIRSSAVVTLLKAHLSAGPSQNQGVLATTVLVTHSERRCAPVRQSLPNL